MCWLPVLWSGTWAELDMLLADRCPDDCAFCGGWLGPVEVASWTDDTQSPGEAWTYCRPCSLRQTRAGAWEPDETLAVLAPGGGTLAEQVDAVKAAHPRRVPATAVTVVDLTPPLPGSAAVGDVLVRTALRRAQALGVGVDTDMPLEGGHDTGTARSAGGRARPVGGDRLTAGQVLAGSRGPVFTVAGEGEDLQVIGASGSGTAATVRALVYPGLAAAREVVIAVDGSSHGLGEFAHLAVGGGIARDRAAWGLAVRLWHAVYRSRRRRVGGAYAWTRPRPGDPLVTLLVTEAAAVAEGLSADHHALIAGAAGYANPLGMRVVQAGHRPMAGQWIGGRAWRDLVRVRLLHTMPDRDAVLIASQGLDTDLDVARMPAGWFAVVEVRHVVATQARAHQVSVDQVSALTQPAHLFPLDRTAAGREWDAYVQAVSK